MLVANANNREAAPASRCREMRVTPGNAKTGAAQPTASKHTQEVDQVHFFLLRQANVETPIVEIDYRPQVFRRATREIGCPRPPGHRSWPMTIEPTS